MTSIKRSDLYLFTKFAKRVFGSNHKNTHAMLISGTGGGELVMSGEDIFLRMQVSSQASSVCIIPWDLMKETAGMTEDKAELTYEVRQVNEKVCETVVTAGYLVHGIPKQVTYQVPIQDMRNVLF